MIHICYERSMTIGGKVRQSRCLMCWTVRELTLGYIGEYCPACDAVISADDSWGYIISRRREKMKVSRKEWAKKFGLKTKTLANYEHGRCPKWYAEFSLKQYKMWLLRKRYKLS